VEHPEFCPKYPNPGSSSIEKKTWEKIHGIIQLPDSSFDCSLADASILCSIVSSRTKERVDDKSIHFVSQTAPVQYSAFSNQ
jgi:hypothetical protein